MDKGVIAGRIHVVVVPERPPGCKEGSGAPEKKEPGQSIAALAGFLIAMTSRTMVSFVRNGQGRLPISAESVGSADDFAAGSVRRFWIPSGSWPFPGVAQASAESPAGPAATRPKLRPVKL